MKLLSHATVAVALCGVMSGAVQAADLAPPAAYDWTGVYLGASLGYGFGENDYTYHSPFTGGPPASDDVTSLDYDGVFGGGQIGANMQTGSIVLGIEADLSASGISGDRKTRETAPCFEDGCKAEVNWFGTGRLRLGYAFDTLMPFVTGGAALLGVEGEADQGACDYLGGCSFNDTVWGWTLGGGVEWGFAGNWSAKAEYLYVSADAPDFSGPSGRNVTADDLDFNLFRLGFNYRFN